MKKLRTGTLAPLRRVVNMKATLNNNNK